MFRSAQHDRATEWDEFLRVGELTARQAPKCFEVFRRTLFDHFLRQTWGRGSFVPIECLEIIAYELLVEARGALPNRVLVFRPETRGIRCQTLVDEKQIFAGS